MVCGVLGVTQSNGENEILRRFKKLLCSYLTQWAGIFFILMHKNKMGIIVKKLIFFRKRALDKIPTILDCFSISRSITAVIMLKNKNGKIVQ